MDTTASPVASPASETATPSAPAGGVSAESRPASHSVGGDASGPASTTVTEPPTSAEAPISLREALKQSPSAAGVPARRGPIPYDRHEAILKKQREDAAAEHAAKFSQYTGIERMTPQQWGAVSGLMTDLANNPLDVIGRLLDELGQNPATAPQLRNWIGQRFPGPAPSAPAAARTVEDRDPMPAPDADGGYTQAGLAKLLTWQSRRTMAEMQKANEPIQAELTRMKSEREMSALVSQANEYATNLLTEVSALPGFKEHQAAIKQKFLSLRFPKGTPNGEITAALYKCYLDVALPTITQSAKQDMLNTLDHKAKASTTSPQGRTAAAPKGRSLGLREALAAEFGK